MNMKFITSNAHGFFDYIGGLLLITLPLIILPAEVPSIATIIPIAIGMAIIVFGRVYQFRIGPF